jgi:hypothetical protein
VSDDVMTDLRDDDIQTTWKDAPQTMQGDDDATDEAAGDDDASDADADATDADVDATDS